MATRIDFTTTQWHALLLSLGVDPEGATADLVVRKAQTLASAAALSFCHEMYDAGDKRQKQAAGENALLVSAEAMAEEAGGVTCW